MTRQENDGGGRDNNFNGRGHTRQVDIAIGRSLSSPAMLASNMSLPRYNVDNVSIDLLMQGAASSAAQSNGKLDFSCRLMQEIQSATLLPSLELAFLAKRSTGSTSLSSRQDTSHPAKMKTPAGV